MNSLRPVLGRLLRRPSFAAVVVATLAACIGANIAIFAVLNGVLLKPLPYADSDRLIAMNHTAPGIGITDLGSAPYLYFIERDQSETLEAVGPWGADTATVTGVGEPESVRILAVARETRRVRRVGSLAGRYCTVQGASPGGARSVVLTEEYAQRRSGRDPSAVGSTLTVGGTPREIIGVLPRSFRWLDRDVDLIDPL